MLVCFWFVMLTRSLLLLGCLSVQDMHDPTTFSLPFFLFVWVDLRPWRRSRGFRGKGCIPFWIYWVFFLSSWMFVCGEWGFINSLVIYQLLSSVVHKILSHWGCDLRKLSVCLFACHWCIWLTTLECPISFFLSFFNLFHRQPPPKSSKRQKQQFEAWNYGHNKGDKSLKCT